MNESQIFLNALQLPTPAQRAAYLNEACTDDHALRVAVEALLRAHETNPDFLEQAVGGFDTTRDLPPYLDRPTGPGASVVMPGAVLGGRYRLFELIGEGGMGSVWSAHQTEPVKRSVAVKLIKPGMDLKVVLDRFEAERQALACMDHPSLAKVLDAGTAPDGRPFFVMELVQGAPITRFCDEHKFTSRERLELFIQVCRAVQHAHQKGIIHRDIKPSNVLVMLCDGRPLAKVIDFGVAKATGPHLTEQTLQTGLGTVVGTLEYMSPEQATFNAIDIDTRTDVYALGALLYELLTGTTPITRQTFKQAAFDEMLRLIREQQPQAPSSRLDTSIDAPSIAANRRTEPKLLGRFVKGEVDWIVMKALSKERDRRYESANGFAQDIERFLAHEPVLAGPPSAGYRFRKFVQRNRGQVLAAGLVLAALIAGIVGTTWGLILADAARDAEAKRADSEEAARSRAVIEKTRAEKAESETITDLYSATRDTLELIGSRPQLGPRERAYLDKARKRWQSFAERRDNDDPSLGIQAQGHMNIGSLWWSFGALDESRVENETARDILERLRERRPDVPEFRRDLALSHYNLGLFHAAVGQRDAARAELDKSLELLEGLAAQYPDVWEHRADLGKTLNELGILLAPEQPQAAQGVYERAQEVRERLVQQHKSIAECRQDLARSYINLALLLAERGDHKLARAKLEKARDLLQKLTEQYPNELVYRQDLAATHGGLRNVLVGLEDRVAAREENQKALDLRKKLAEEYPGIPKCQLLLSISYYETGQLVRDEGKPKESLPWYDQAIATIASLHRAEPRNVRMKSSLSQSHAGRAAAHAALKQHTDAVKDWDRARELGSEAEQSNYRAARATSLVHIGRIGEAVSEVRALTVSTTWTAIQWYDFARVLAVASGKGGDGKLANADRAVELLRHAVKGGYKDAARLAVDADLDSLRDRDDFRKLFVDLAAPSR